jgi:biopolymer transport protein ExbD
MRIRGAKQVHYDSGPNMTPLVDVVMVLLIFLMMAGSFAGAERFLMSQAAYRAQGAGAAPPPPGGIPEDEPLQIRVDSPTPDRFIARVGQIQTDNARTLAAELTRMREALGPDAEPPIEISPGRDVKYRFLIEVYEAALAAEFTKIHFAPSR